MFWVGLSVLIMSMTGIGDDTRMFLSFVEKMQLLASEEIHEPARKAKVLSTLDDFRKEFFEHRARLGKVGDCIEKLDRSYAVTLEQYQACGRNQADVMGDAANALIGVRKRLAAAVTPDERKIIQERMIH
jgi:hypothetical protein